MNQTAQFFNSVARDWDSRAKVSDAKVRHIVESAGVRRGDSVLDIGTGTGILLPELARTVGHFGQIDALDFASEMLSVAHDKHAALPLQVRFLLADIENDNIHNLYDSIILYNVMPYLQHPLQTVLRLYSNNLAGGGSLTIAHSQSREEVNKLANGRHLPMRELPPAAAFAARIADAGFHVEYVEDTPEAYIIRVMRH